MWCLMPLMIPLQQPVTPIDDRDRVRQHRTLLVPGIGDHGQARLRAAKVLVVGAGGLGSPVILYLAAAGIGTIGVSDDDVVEFSNLQRQVIHTESDVGRPKVTSAIDSGRALNSHVEFTDWDLMTPERLPEAVAAHDLVLECTDNFAAKYAVGDACAAAGVPLVWGTIVSMAFQVSVFWTGGDDPVSLRQLHPNVPEPGTVPTSFDIGVLGPVVGQCGSVMATEAVKLITGVGEPLLGRVLVADAAAGRWDVLPFGPASRG